MIARVADEIPFQILHNASSRGEFLHLISTGSSPHLTSQGSLSVCAEDRPVIKRIVGYLRKQEVRATYSMAKNTP